MKAETEIKKLSNLIRANRLQMMDAATTNAQQTAIMDADSAATAAFWAIKDKELGDNSQLVKNLTAQLEAANVRLQKQFQNIKNLSQTLQEITAAVQMASTIALVAFA